MQVTRDNPRHSLTIRPTYACITYERKKKARSIAQIGTTRNNFKTNTTGHQVSKQSERKIRLATQWLVQLADNKPLKDPATGKEYRYKAGLVTLSLPTGNENLKPDFFKSILLSSFLDACQYHWNLKNYIWKIERQKRGALHVHITVDQFIPYEWLNQFWNGLLNKYGLLDDYRKRFKSMTLRQYVQYRNATDPDNYKAKFPSTLSYTKQIIKAYQFNDNHNWTRPNTTDIHSVKNVKDLGAYLAKYLTKDPDLGSSFKGRFWGCSYGLSRVQNCRVSIGDECLNFVARDLENASYKYEELYRISKIDQEPIFIGVLFFLKSVSECLRTSAILARVFRKVKEIHDTTGIHSPPLFDFCIINKSYNFSLVNQ